MAEQAPLAGKTIAILAADGFEQVELTEPKKALEQAGAEVHVVAPHDGAIRGLKHMEQGDEVGVDQTLERADAASYDGLVIPGGVFSPDQLRIDDRAVGFVRDFFEAGKPVGAICHGPQLLINAELVEGRIMTGYPAIRRDLANAGARVEDREVVVDGGLVTSRSPDDIPAFCRKLIEEFAEGRHRRQAQAM
ncbi:MAG TPA: type 1 glutamine amidotransferase domain-containing protein [Alphaproteobacteria bacterium]|nr:type 1 glutamine amidotransferase domain-containing protein [Alphaproteobacteria bacterium]